MVEDNETEVMLVREALDEIEMKIELEVYTDGDEEFKNALETGKLPDLIMLDINLPGSRSGIEVLKELKGGEHKKIPVLMFSTSTLPSDITDSYEIGANSYLKKPAKLEDFLEAFKILSKYWFKTVELTEKK